MSALAQKGASCACWGGGGVLRISDGGDSLYCSFTKEREKRKPAQSGERAVTSRYLSLQLCSHHLGSLNGVHMQELCVASQAIPVYVACNIPSLALSVHLSVQLNFALLLFCPKRLFSESGSMRPSLSALHCVRLLGGKKKKVMIRCINLASALTDMP